MESGFAEAFDEHRDPSLPETDALRRWKLVVVVVGSRSKWRRKKIGFAEASDEHRDLYLQETDVLRRWKLVVVVVGSRSKWRRKKIRNELDISVSIAAQPFHSEQIKHVKRDNEPDTTSWQKGSTLGSGSYGTVYEATDARANKRVKPSFTMSNDDDSSGTTPGPTNTSPNERIRPDTTYWEKGNLLGRGSFGSVHEGIAVNGVFFAIKEVSLLDQGSEGKLSIYQLEHEIALLSKFKHENIVQYYGTEKDESNLHIFLELVTQGSLLKVYQKFHLLDPQVSRYTRQILHGLKYLHDRNVVHRDIKCANILVDANGFVKLADFGLAKATKLNDPLSCKGTAFWMAPEVVNGKNQGYGLPADIWSLGCTVLEMLTRKIPYEGLEGMAALFKIGKGERPPIPDSLSKDARDFVLPCLQAKAHDRPTAAQLLDHPFVKSSVHL